MGDNLLEWIAMVISIGCSIFRACNLGYQGWTYLISIGTYLIFIIHATKNSQLTLNIFYIATSLMGAYRWGLYN